MTPDVAVPINGFLVVALMAAVAAWIGIWNRPDYLRRIAARYLARAESLDRSRTVFESSLRRWQKRLHIPAALAPREVRPKSSWPRTAAVRER